ncbi:Predicted arabinose efflux permease, MFS family [Pseudonocardia ammonioxydans]|uniref:Predicted arabinose efflux permease, MFS family n=1 Tax=Pseudonocardia ammonioxydans TaxID=260086 RepID=A0A1I4V989_PSUAM|nr:MFS transporter [Pseudonocardia ammonioxydans]SFM97733.1 Predicted arabinose efflux permease, MFS family [Pseudonocardia ammonioxydans]
MRGGDAHPAPSPPPSSRAPALTILALAQFTTTLEFSIVHVALPAIDRDLHLGPVLLQWVPSAYAVFLAGLLLVSGRLAERFGPLRMFRWAVLLLAAASALAAVAPDSATLLGARAAQGAAAALLQPAALGLLQHAVPDPAARARAFAAWSAAGATGLAVGAAVGGLLTLVSWRWTFAVTVPLLLPCAAGALFRLRAPATPACHRAVPVAAALLGTGAALAVVTALTVIAGTGRPGAATVLVCAAAVVLPAVFLCHEARAQRVLVDRALRRCRNVRLGTAVAALYMASAGSTYYLLTLLLQQVHGRTAFAAGVAFLPLTVSVAVAGPLAGRLLHGRSPARVACAGFALCAAGLFGLSAVVDAPYPVMLPALVLTGLGNGVVFTALFVLGTTGVPAGLRGSAGGLLTTGQYVAGAVALALLTLVLGPGVDATRIGLCLVLTAAAGTLGFLVTARRALTEAQYGPGWP